MILTATFVKFIPADLTVLIQDIVIDGTPFEKDHSYLQSFPVLPSTLVNGQTITATCELYTYGKNKTGIRLLSFIAIAHMQVVVPTVARDIFTLYPEVTSVTLASIGHVPRVLLEYHGLEADFLVKPHKHTGKPAQYQLPNGTWAFAKFFKPVLPATITLQLHNDSYYLPDDTNYENPINLKDRL